MLFQLFADICQWYWKKICNTWHVWNPVNNGIFTYIYHINWLAGYKFFFISAANPRILQVRYPRISAMNHTGRTGRFVVEAIHVGGDSCGTSVPLFPQQLPTKMWLIVGNNFSKTSHPFHQPPEKKNKIWNISPQICSTIWVNGHRNPPQKSAKIMSAQRSTVFVSPDPWPSQNSGSSSRGTDR